MSVTEQAKGRLYIIGDFNSRVGWQDDKHKTVPGKHGETTRNNVRQKFREDKQNQNLKNGEQFILAQS